MFALIRYYYKIEPYERDINDVARLWLDLAWIRETQKEASENG